MTMLNKALSFLILFTFAHPALAQQQGDMYGAAYMECLQGARQRTQYVHESVREQALGEMLNACMFSKGWQQFAPVDDEQEKRERLIWMNNGY